MDESYVKTKIKQLCEERGWTNYRLAKKCGMPDSTIHNILKKSDEPSLSSVRKICDGFGITMAQFFAEDGTPPDLTKMQRELLETFDCLSQHQKELALAYLKGMAARK